MWWFRPYHVVKRRNLTGVPPGTPRWHRTNMVFSLAPAIEGPVPLELCWLAKILKPTWTSLIYMYHEPKITQVHEPKWDWSDVHQLSSSDKSSMNPHLSWVDPQFCCLDHWPMGHLGSQSVRAMAQAGLEDSAPWALARRQVTCHGCHGHVGLGDVYGAVWGPCGHGLQMV